MNSDNSDNTLYLYRNTLYKHNNRPPPKQYLTRIKFKNTVEKITKKPLTFKNPYNGITFYNEITIAQLYEINKQLSEITKNNNIVIDDNLIDYNDISKKYKNISFNDYNQIYKEVFDTYYLTNTTYWIKRLKYLYCENKIYWVPFSSPQLLNEMNSDKDENNYFDTIEFKQKEGELHEKLAQKDYEIHKEKHLEHVKHAIKKYIIGKQLHPTRIAKDYDYLITKEHLLDNEPTEMD